ncbi:Maf family nucleotide pyrophosphatase [Xinfangfangia sp. CPCC 101601]|uniref:Nucleoside triphosphate pyrophosphatase n=1 Tax=Pseudogemmobacter lacusdianii TaxID=3069608 RepID=A0ABU0VTX8_9RHOB|nr:Maf family nucleotide pyrophosphatase [Xinfangfangia sp. CPCC 101601]MDQ2065182.1 Maf family nucleotide pyrophosphatase [Xinfangfangia sp. CPCC 101601]
MIILASASEIRQTLLKAAQIPFEIRPARVDEESIRAALEAEGASARDLADTLAEMKARKIAEKDPSALVLGCDQVLELDGKVFSKPESPEHAADQLRALSNQTHRLLSALVIYDKGQPVWRHVGTARLTMRPLSEAYLQDYVARNWDSIRHAVGCYKLEEEGVRLFSAIEGDHFTILGLPMLPLLSYLQTRGFIAA